MTYKFSRWIKWTERENYSNIHYPGVYIIAYSKKDISDNKLKFVTEIIYIGMTNSKDG